MSEYTLDDAIEISNKITIGSINLIGAAVTFLIGVILVKLLWYWTIPELFPAAIEQGFILGDITWLAAFKITGLVAVLTSAGSIIAGKWGRVYSLCRSTGIQFSSNTVHKNRLVCLSSDFSHHCASSKGESWINLG